AQSAENMSAECCRSDPSAGFEPASALSQLLAILRVARGGIDPKRRRRYPQIYPTKSWLQVELGGRWWKKRAPSRYEASICGLDVYGSQRTSTDVLGWLAGPDSKSIATC